jgi:hypothetical protein
MCFGLGKVLQVAYPVGQALRRTALSVDALRPHHYSQEDAWLGRRGLAELEVCLHTDASFAESGDQKSASGCHVCVKGSGTYFPVAGRSKRQGRVSSSTAETALVAAHEALRATGFPAWDGFGVLRGLLGLAPSRLRARIDSTAMLEANRTGRNRTTRHLPRLHGVAVGWLREQRARHDVRVSYIDSSMTAADIFTKPFTDRAPWEVLRQLLGAMTVAQVESGAMARLRQRTVLDDATTMMTSGYDLGSMPKRAPGWDNGLGWHRREEIEYVVAREPHLFRQRSDSTWTFRSSWVKSPQGWRQLEQDCAWSDIPRRSARVPGWVEKGIFLFSEARGSAPVSQRVSEPGHDHQAQDVLLEQRRVSPIIPRGASRILQGGLWRRTRDPVSLDVSRSGAFTTSQGLAEGFDLPSPVSFCCNMEPSSVAMNTLAKAQSTLVASRPNSVAILAQGHTLTRGCGLGLRLVPRPRATNANNSTRVRQTNNATKDKLRHPALFITPVPRAINCPKSAAPQP